MQEDLGHGPRLSDEEFERRIVDLHRGQAPMPSAAEEEHLRRQELELTIVRLESGQLGGDQQIGAKIAEGEVDFVIFFWDPLEPLPHDPDIKALLRVAMVWNIPVACNRSSADFMMSSPLMESGYLRWVPDYTIHRARFSNAGSNDSAA